MGSRLLLHNACKDDSQRVLVAGCHTYIPEVIECNIALYRVTYSEACACCDSLSYSGNAEKGSSHPHRRHCSELLQGLKERKVLQRRMLYMTCIRPQLGLKSGLRLSWQLNLKLTLKSTFAPGNPIVT